MLYCWCCIAPLKRFCVLLSPSAFHPCNSSLFCLILSQLPSHPVDREPLQCPSAKKDGPVPGWDPGGQTWTVQHQSWWVWTSAVTRNTQGEDPRQGKVRLWVHHKELRSTDWMFKRWLILLSKRSQSSGDYLNSPFIIWTLKPTEQPSKAADSRMVEVMRHEWNLDYWH